MKSCGSWSLIGWALAILMSAGLFLTACSNVSRTVVVPLANEGAQYVGNATCAECHADIARQFPSSPHARFHHGDWVARPGDKSHELVSGCESCHGPGGKHVQAGGGRGQFITNPGNNPKACFQCHLGVHAQFRLAQHHPVIEGQMNCVHCHDPHGRDIMKPAGGLAMARVNESCADCHRDQARPFIYEHEALREGCTTCHAPHGTVHDKLLVQRDVNLCLKCHAQMQGPDVTGQDLRIGKVSHASLVRQGTCWSAGCHTAVHGSNINPRMLY